MYNFGPMFSFSDFEELSEKFVKASPLSKTIAGAILVLLVLVFFLMN